MIFMSRIVFEDEYVIVVPTFKEVLPTVQICIPLAQKQRKAWR